MRPCCARPSTAPRSSTIRTRGTACGAHPRRRDRLPAAADRAAASQGLHERALPAAHAPDHDRDPGDGRRRRRRAGRLADRSCREQHYVRRSPRSPASRSAPAPRSITWRSIRDAAHRAAGAPAGAGADAGARRCRYRDRVGADGSRPRDPARAGHARSHHADRLDAIASTR